MAEAEPLLSVVATSRNDDHGGTLLRRTQTFINVLINQCKRHNLSAELLLVEWNPPPDRLRLAQVLSWPEDPSPCQVRIIEVPAEIHQRYKHAEALPLFQMIGKNVGIRRARGQYVLATNIDILFSDELMQYIKGGNLRPGRMYRIDRHDVMTDVPVDAPLDEQLRYCREHLIRINAREGTFNLTAEGQRALAPRDIAKPDIGVSFGPGWYPAEDWDGEILRWVTNDAELVVQAPPGPAQALRLEMEPGPGVADKPFRLEVRTASGDVISQGVVECRQRVSFMVPLQAGQSGRFILHIEGGGRPTANNPRILNFAVFHCSWGPPWGTTDPPAEGCYNFQALDVGVLGQRDIATADMGLRFSRGWYPVEYWDSKPLRWAASGATLMCHQPAGPLPALTLEMKPGPGDKPFVLEVRNLLGQVLARGEVGRTGGAAGQGWHSDDRQRVSFLLPGSCGQPEQFTLHAVGGDSATVDEPNLWRFCVYRCSWTPAWSEPAPVDSAGAFNFRSEEVAVLVPGDIAPSDAGIQFGRGWHPLEHAEGRPLRWVANDATVVVEPPDGPAQVLCLEMRPGFGVGFKPFELQVRDPSGWIVARGRVGDTGVSSGRGWHYDDRQLVSLRLPVRPGQTGRFTLHVEGGGQSAPNDTRLLNFCVWRCSWAPAWEVQAGKAQPGEGNFKTESVSVLTLADIAAPQDGVSLGRGWYGVEQSNGEVFRWAGQDAELVLAAPAGPTQVFRLEIKPGPGVGHAPFELQVRDQKGETVASGQVAGRQRVYVRLPIRAGQLERFTLHAVGGGRTSAREARVLNFRVFRCGWEPLPAPAPFRTERAREPHTLPGLLLRRLKDTTLGRLRGKGSVLQRYLGWLTGSSTGPRALQPPADQGKRTGNDVPGPSETAPAAKQVEEKEDIISPVHLHTNACGDFTLMARKHWWDIYGYPEFEMYSLHIDSLGCYMAHHGGALEEVLPEPMRVYHIEHGAGSGWTPEGAAKLFERLAAKGIPVLEYNDLCTWATQMRRRDMPLIFNDAGWGLAEHDLPETVIGGAASAVEPVLHRIAG